MRLRSAHGLVALSTAALVSAFLAPTTAYAGEAGDPGAVLDTQTVTLSAANRVTGMPTDSNPGRQLSSAVIESDLHPEDTRDWLTATVVLAGDPPSTPSEYDDDAHLVVGYGHLAGSDCQLSARSDDVTKGHSREYDEINWVGEDGYGKIGERPATPFDCVAVVLQSLDGTLTYDAMVGTFTNTYLSPRIETGNLTLLGGRQKRLKLVKGVWTRYALTVKNTGDYKVDSLALTGRGKGVKVRGDRDDNGVAPGESTTVALRVKLTGKSRKAKLKLTVDAGNGVKDTRKLRVTQVASPRKPSSGSYRSPNGDVTFSVRKGKVTNFRITTTTECGTYLNHTSTTNNYDFPTTKIPRNGILDATDKGTTSGPGKWSASLQLKMAGAKVSHAQFDYYFYQPGVVGSNCSAGASFKVKRGR